jgi:hypothetical protein
MSRMSETPNPTKGGFFAKLFRRRVQRVPAWASDFVERERFDAFVEAVQTALSSHGHQVDAASIESGSVTLADPASLLGQREWILHILAVRCAATSMERWLALIELDYLDLGPEVEGSLGGALVRLQPDLADPRAPAPQGGIAAVLSKWPPSSVIQVMGTSTCGGVILLDGLGRQRPLAMILLPVADPSSCDVPPDIPKGTLQHLVVCNGGDHGFLAASAIGRELGVERVLAVAPDRSVDRIGADEGAVGEPTARNPGAPPVVALPSELQCGSLTIKRSGNSVLAVWENGTTALVGDAVASSQTGNTSADFIVGRIDIGAFSGGRQLAAFLHRTQKIIILANVPGIDPIVEASSYSEMGFASAVVNLESDETKAPAE